MKRIYLNLALLGLTLPFCSNLTAVYSSSELHSIKALGNVINSPIMTRVDGAFPIILLLKFLKMVEGIINHNHATQKDTYISLHILAAREKTFPPDKREAYVKKSIAALVSAAHEGSFFKMFDIAHPFFNVIVEDWSAQFSMQGGKFYAFAKKWQHLGTEFDILAEDIRTLTEYESYLLELRQFLHDLIASCPKAYADYQSRL